MIYIMLATRTSYQNKCDTSSLLRLLLSLACRGFKEEWSDRCLSLKEERYRNHPPFLPLLPASRPQMIRNEHR